MAKNLVICSDGTGNTFDSRVTNVTRLVKNLVLDQPQRQLVIYDQGLGTTGKREKTARASQSEGIHFLDAPLSSRFDPAGWVGKMRGLAFGYGLKENIRQMYRELARLHEDGDRLFLFGFSRGAFTVRALAGLLHRCHLAPGSEREIDERFEESWELFQPMIADDRRVESLRAQHRPCPVHFLGVWDTVKSYGGLKPVVLPHLRHNPDVAHVRHALAIEERRAWFKPTTWGLLDLDEKGAMTRIDTTQYEDQDISEVWFTGCHSDVGGGGEETVTTRVALRWMLAEAASLDQPLLVSDAGWALLVSEDAEGPLPIEQSWKLSWRLLEQIPRNEIDNSGVYPVVKRHRGSDGVRHPSDSKRAGPVSVHSTVADPTSIGAQTKRVETKRVLRADE